MNDTISSIAVNLDNLVMYGLLGILTALLVLLIGSYVSIYIVSRRYRRKKK